MNKKTLTQELDRMKHYLKKINKEGNNVSLEESKIRSHTLVGMIMSIHNLIKTGAYNLNDNSHHDLYSTISQARHKAVHYGFFDEFSDIKDQAKEITSNIPSNLEDHFSNSYSKINFLTNETFYLIENDKNSKIYESLTMNGFYVFKNLITNEKVYISKENLLIVENDATHQRKYLIKLSDDKTLYYKSNESKESNLVSFNELLNNNQEFLSPFIIKNMENKVGAAIEKITKQLNEVPYANLIINYSYNDKKISITAQNLLQDYIYNHTINEKVLNKSFTIQNYQMINKPTSLNIRSLATHQLFEAASLTDLFYMEIFLKKYNLYKTYIIKLQQEGKQISSYAKQSMLLNLFEIGVLGISQEFLNSDKTKKLKGFYYEYKALRNQLAHNAISNKEEKELLIEYLEQCSQDFYNLASTISNLNDKEKNKHALSKLNNAYKLDENNQVIYNKTYKFAKFKHISSSKIINGRKYLKLNSPSNKNAYLEIDGSLLALDYNTMISKECIVPIDHIHMVEIDCNTNRIKPLKTKIKPEEIINTDQYLSSLLQSYNYLKSFIPDRNKLNIPYFCAITLYDKNGTAVCSERINNIIYRRLSQKIIPNQLLEASTVILPKNPDEPITILNKNKAIVAKVYWACINYINGKEAIIQALQDGSTKEIEYGKVLPKNLKTNDIILTTKEGDNYEKRN